MRKDYVKENLHQSVKIDVVLQVYSVVINTGDFGSPISGLNPDRPTDASIIQGIRIRFF